MQLKLFTMVSNSSSRSIPKITLLLVLTVLMLCNCWHVLAQEPQVVLQAQQQQQQQHRHHNNNLNIKYMLDHHDKLNHSEAHVKKFKGETLAYVTPWNSRGYDIVKEFKGKFD
ncbi:hypothetical protein BDF20DRAFT_54921 [Mycotypha africana]|uniref:uncharacterized protein n=1 Tax=Mycotypha africana TaxID=64632 RepID=UPI002301C2C6|nr:uncharacterized protein BDF20DRAFT_54921 [Mycotypha africana]KAI8991662.1 hypothetical protein BDF20DRAFT_54921 [Mycotypha africana]